MPERPELGHIGNQLRGEARCLITRRSSRSNLRLGEIPHRAAQKLLLLRKIKIHLVSLALHFFSSHPFALSLTETEGGGCKRYSVTSRLSPRDFDRLHKLNDLFEGRAGREDLLHAHAFKRSHVLLRNDAAAENRDAPAWFFLSSLITSPNNVRCAAEWIE